MIVIKNIPKGKGGELALLILQAKQDNGESGESYNKEHFPVSSPCPNCGKETYGSTSCPHCGYNSTGVI